MGITVKSLYVYSGLWQLEENLTDHIRYDCNESLIEMRRSHLESSDPINHSLTN